MQDRAKKNARQREHYSLNKDLYKARTQKWRAANKDRIARVGKVLYETKAYYARYGLTKKIYDELLRFQDGVCALCKGPPGNKPKFAIDHDHATGNEKTGNIRGLLCSSCNSALGLFRDRADVLRRAADYVEATRKVRIS